MQYILLLATFGFTLTAVAQRSIRGIVIDTDTEQPVVGVTVRVVEQDRSASTSASGRFSIPVSSDTVSVELRRLGYETKTATLVANQYTTIELEPQNSTIEQVTIHRRRKYSNRNNPAVELIDLVIRHKHENKLSGKKRIQFKQYDKLKFGLLDAESQPLRRLSFLKGIFENADTTTLSGQTFSGIYLEENLSNVYSQKDPSRYKKLITHQVKTELDPRYVNNPNIQAFINYGFQPIDVYDESIFWMNKLLLSPIADNGKIFYRYYIVDTIENEHGRFVELEFVPRNKTDLLFSGNLKVSLDGRYAVKEAVLMIDRSANLNWINSATMELKYTPREDRVMLLDTAVTKVSFGAGSRELVYGERISVHYGYDLASPIEEHVFAVAPIEVSAKAAADIPERPLRLTDHERETYVQIARLNRDPAFRALMATGYLVAQGYYNLGGFELGPLEYAYSRNNIEGDRFRIGGRTTQLLSDKLYLEGYLAYGARDGDFKFFASGAFSLNGENIATFPAHYIQGAVQHDILEPGRDMDFRRGDSFFMSLRRNRPTKWFSTEAYRLRHVLEFGNHVSITTTFTHTKRYTAGDFRLISSSDPSAQITDINTNEAQIELRWAPYEKFFYRNLTRSTIVERHPVFTVAYHRGIPGFWGADYAYDKVSAAASKRFFLNQLGFADVTVSAGKIWGTLPYALLHLPNVRQNPGRHTITYDLMNSMEFAADEYVRIGMTHQMEGFLLNKIPLIKRLKLREIWGAQMFYGKLSDHNRPDLGRGVVQFDTDANGLPLTHGLGTAPYWEGSAGVDNILRLLRLEYVRRFTHTDFPNISTDRWRLSLNINF